MAAEKKRIGAVLNDLLFQVKIREAAKRASIDAVFVKSRDDAVALALERPAAIILDLNASALGPLELIEALKGDERTKGVTLIGYVSHVQTELRQAAQGKGCDVVLARSAFSENLQELLARFAAE